jgi:hypothetical protein
MPATASDLLSRSTVPQTPLEELAAALGADVARIERDMRQRIGAFGELVQTGVADIAERTAALGERVEERLAELRDPVVAPDELAPLISRAAALLAEAPPLVRVPPAIPGPVVNVTVPLPPASPPRVERSRVKHDDAGRIVEIERDVA